MKRKELVESVFNVAVVLTIFATAVYFDGKMEQRLVEANQTPTATEVSYEYNPIHVEEIVEESKELITLRTIAYCPCEKCCGWNTGITYSGTTATAGRTIGANLEQFPIGTELEIDGITYVVEDKGNLSKGTIDIFFNSHEEALNYGVQYKVAKIK